MIGLVRSSPGHGSHGASHTLFFAVGDPRPSPDVEVDLPARPYDVLGIADGRRWQLELPTDSLHVMPVPAPS